MPNPILSKHARRTLARKIRTATARLKAGADLETSLQEILQTIHSALDAYIDSDEYNKAPWPTSPTTESTPTSGS